MRFKTKKILTLVGVTLLFYLPHLVLAQVGATGMNLLHLTPNPRSLALGEATSAGEGGAAAVYWNPAGLGLTASPQLSVNYRPLVVEAHLIQVQGLLPLSPWGLGFDFSYLSFGDIPLYESGRQTQTASPYELRLGVVGSWTIFKWLHWGLQINWLRQELTVSALGDGFSFDLGFLLYRPWPQFVFLDRLAMSLVVQHLGLGPTYFDQATPLPTRVVVGWCYNLPLKQEAVEFSQINFSLDLGWVEAIGFTMGGGAEWLLPPIDIWEIALRVGYKLPTSGDPLFGLGAGLGLGWQGLQINYSFAGEGDFGFGHVVGVNYTFAKPVKSINTD